MQTRINDGKQARWHRAGAAWLVAAILAGCGGAALIVPFFTFGFGFSGNIDGAPHSVSLNLSPNAPTSSSGPFTAPSNITFDNANQYDVQGSYSECTMSFTLVVVNPLPTPTAPFASSYNGRFTDRDTIELTPTVVTQPPLATLTLTRSFSTDTRPTTC